MGKLAIIGGSGSALMDHFELLGREVVATPFGEPSAPIAYLKIHNQEVAFLPRHGMAHTVPPHKINYRANLWALKHIGIDRVIGLASVGGITKQMIPGHLAIPDQLIDYTWGREHTYFESDLSQVTHIDFTEPYCTALRSTLLLAAKEAQIDIEKNGTYGVTQGPRLETAMEINKMEREGCDLVGMTGMPEASLARELNLCYASCATVANWAAGRGDGPITMKEILKNMEIGTEKIKAMLNALAS